MQPQQKCVKSIFVISGANKNDDAKLLTAASESGYSKRYVESTGLERNNADTARRRATADSCAGACQQVSADQTMEPTSSTIFFLTLFSFL